MRERFILQAPVDDDTFGSGGQSPEDQREGTERPRFVQPKAEDAKEVERLGLMKVPRRFSFLGAKKALAAGTVIIARSEHPDEAKGESGVNPSWTFKKYSSLLYEDLATFEHEVLSEDDLMKRVDKYCEVNGIDLEKHNEGLSWSFWEKIPGINLSVVEDNTVQGRYYILASWEIVEECRGEKPETRNVNNVFMVQNGQIVSDANNYHDSPTDLRNRIGEIAKNYEGIRNHFGTQTAWVVEMQLAPNSDLYFLQRHPTRDYEKCDWTFDDEPSGEDIIVKSDARTIVRGSTPKDGWEIEMLYDGYGRLQDLPQQQAFSRLDTHGAIIPYQKWIGSAAVFIETDGSSGAKTQDSHSSIIPLTKPDMYLCIPDFEKRLGTQWGGKLDEIETEKSRHRAEHHDALDADVENGNISKYKRETQISEYNRDIKNFLRIKMLVRSDGTEARIRILDIH